jgi:hypothetical protein
MRGCLGPGVRGHCCVSHCRRARKFQPNNLPPYRIAACVVEPGALPLLHVGRPPRTRPRPMPTGDESDDKLSRGPQDYNSTQLSPCRQTASRHATREVPNTLWSGVHGSCCPISTARTGTASAPQAADGALRKTMRDLGHLCGAVTESSVRLGH